MDAVNKILVSGFKSMLDGLLEEKGHLRPNQLILAFLCSFLGNVSPEYLASAKGWHGWVDGVSLCQPEIKFNGEEDDDQDEESNNSSEDESECGDIEVQEDQKDKKEDAQDDDQEEERPTKVQRTQTTPNPSVDPSKSPKIAQEEVTDN